MTLGLVSPLSVPGAVGSEVVLGGGVEVDVVVCGEAVTVFVTSTVWVTSLLVALKESPGDPEQAVMNSTGIAAATHNCFIVFLHASSGALASRNGLSTPVLVERISA